MSRKRDWLVSISTRPNVRENQQHLTGSRIVKVQARTEKQARRGVEQSWQRPQGDERIVAARPA